MEEDFVKQLFQFVNESVYYRVDTAEHLKGFLDFLAGIHGNLSMANKVLVYGYNPNATNVNTKDRWESQGIQVLDESQMIHTLQYAPESEFGYVDRVMYDVSSTNAEPTQFESFPDAGFFAERLIISAPCPIHFQEQSKPGMPKAIYLEQDNTIHVTKGFKNETEVCHYLLREYGHFYLKGADRNPNGYSRDEYAVNAHAVSYAICKRYGIDPPPIDSANISNGLEPKEILKVLGGINDAMNMISFRIAESKKQTLEIGKVQVQGRE